MEQPDNQPKRIAFFDSLEKFADKMRYKAFRSKPQPMSEFGMPHGGFQRRMIAASVDVLILSLTLFPFSTHLTSMALGVVDMNFVPLLQMLEGVENASEREQIIHGFLVESGRLEYFKMNSSLQLFSLYIYCSICWKYWCATPGKMLVRLKVLDEKTGKPLGFIQSFWRCVGYFFSGIVLCLGILWICVDKRRQGWHDKLASSIVVAKPIDWSVLRRKGKAK